MLFLLTDLNVLHIDSPSHQRRKPRRRRPYRGGRVKLTPAIPVFVIHRHALHPHPHPPHPLSVLDTSTCLRDVANTRHSLNVIYICNNPGEKHITVCCSFTAQSIRHRDERTELENFVPDDNFAVLFLTETWLRCRGDELASIDSGWIQEKVFSSRYTR